MSKQKTYPSECPDCGLEQFKPKRRVGTRCKPCSARKNALRAKEANTKHGYHKHPCYSKWEDMVQRCYNPENKAYQWYGAKGVFVCRLWRDDPASFVEWTLENGWQPEGRMSIDRIDHTDGYYPENCRVIPQSENSRRAILKTKAWEYEGARGRHRDKSE